MDSQTLCERIKSITHFSTVVLLVVFFVASCAPNAEQASEEAAQEEAVEAVMDKVISGEQNSSKADGNLNSANKVDEFRESFESANIAFNAPEQMNIEQESEIQLLLAFDMPAEALAEMITEEGAIETGVVEEVSAEILAELTGGNFEIEAITPVQQAISREKVTEWGWSIIPKKKGPHNLRLALSAVFYIGEQDKTVFIKKFERTIFVDITDEQKVTDFLNNNWQWLWAVFVAPLLPIVWSRFKKKKNVQSD